MNRLIIALSIAFVPRLADAQSEIRAQPVGMASHYTSIGPNDYDSASSLRAGVGGRWYAGPHGLLVDFEYTYNVVAGFVTYDDDRGGFGEDYGIAHAGYAFRRFVPAPRRMHRAFAFTLHASLSFGYAATEFQPDGPVYPRRESIRSRDPVIGGRVGADVDIHFRQYFVGWGLNVDALRHLRPQREGGGLELTRSFLIGHNAVPFMRFGITIGPRCMVESCHESSSRSWSDSPAP